ncbi:MAG: PEP/pyruvate-binding domain-containing protein [Candidatus ainarchaeum sp.]|nr:PEP/pyruvate-binding domain-containing protein [Candidatus ainarchaeum sp.]
MNEKYVYYFTEGNKSMKEILGGKGANIAEMKNLDVPVPPAFTITTQTCDFYIKNNSWPETLENDIKENLKKIEQETQTFFGGEENPLLLSVRSGAAVSMPGMMDTVLNLGLNDKTVLALSKKSGNERFAYDSY